MTGGARNAGHGERGEDRRRREDLDSLPPHHGHIVARVVLVDSNHSGVDASIWTKRKLHFVGIGGAGMSGLALVSRALGADVTGSDRTESTYTARLRERGIVPVIGHRSEN